MKKASKTYDPKKPPRFDEHNTSTDPLQPRFYDTESFRKLQREWDKKLKADGFDDIEPLNENGSRNTPYLKNHSIRIYKRYNASRADYYRLAGQFAEDLTSPVACTLTKNQRLAWRMHADGEPLAKIRDAIKPPRLAYWAMKKYLQDIRNLFKTWCQQEAWRDRQDSLHEDEGGLDAWLDNVAASDTAPDDA